MSLFVFACITSAHITSALCLVASALKRQTAIWPLFLKSQINKFSNLKAFQISNLQSQISNLKSPISNLISPLRPLVRRSVKAPNILILSTIAVLNLRNREQLSADRIHLQHLGEIQRPRASSAKHRELVATLINCAIAIQPFRYGKSRPVCVLRRNQLGIRPRAEPEVAGHRFRRSKLHHPKAVVAIRNVSEQAHIRHSDFYISRVVDLLISVEHLIDARALGLLDVENDQALLTRRNVSIGAHEIDVVGFRK